VKFLFVSLTFLEISRPVNYSKSFSFSKKTVIQTPKNGYLSCNKEAQINRNRKIMEIFEGVDFVKVFIAAITGGTVAYFADTILKKIRDTFKR